MLNQVANQLKEENLFVQGLRAGAQKEVKLLAAAGDVNYDIYSFNK